MNKSESHGYYDGIGKASKRVGYRVRTGYHVSLALFIVWLFVSVNGSAVKAQDGNCDKNYPIDSLFITNLFCEIKKGGVK